MKAPRRHQFILVSDIFISYATEDKARIKPLVDALQLCGWTVWWDRTILAGKVWEREIERALSAARCVIVAWSQASVESEWVWTEADEGKRRSILVPLLLDPVIIPLAFRRIQAANLVSWRGETPNAEFEQLALAVTALLGSPKPTEVPRRTSEELPAADETQTVDHGKPESSGAPGLTKAASSYDPGYYSPERIASRKANATKFETTPEAPDTPTYESRLARAKSSPGPTTPSGNDRRRSLILAAVGVICLIGLATYFAWRPDRTETSLTPNKQAVQPPSVTQSKIQTAPEVQQRTDPAMKEVGTSVLQGYRIELFYLDTNGKSKQHAENVFNALQQQGLPSIIKLSGATQAFLKRLNYPDGNEVRYEDPIELDQANAMLAALKKADPSTVYSTVAVGNRTPNYISVFFNPSEN